MGFVHFFINVFLHLDKYLIFFIVQYGAWVYVLLFLIIFCEMGLVIAAVMPGDSLLFATGSIAATGALNIRYLMCLFIVATFFGYILNYWVGNKLGKILFKNENSLIFKKAYLERTRMFYQKYGGRTILIACFIPIIRTFTPFVAGMSNMRRSKFVIFSLIGSCTWVILLLCSSYWFGNIPFVRANFSLVILVIIFISILPPIVEYVRHKRRGE